MDGSVDPCACFVTSMPTSISTASLEMPAATRWRWQVLDLIDPISDKWRDCSQNSARSCTQHSSWQFWAVLETWSTMPQSNGSTRAAHFVFSLPPKFSDPRSRTFFLLEPTGSRLTSSFSWFGRVTIHPTCASFKSWGTSRPLRLVSSPRCHKLTEYKWEYMVINSVIYIPHSRCRRSGSVSADLSNWRTWRKLCTWSRMRHTHPWG